jgi:hypothetical protein
MHPWVHEGKEMRHSKSQSHGDVTVAKYEFGVSVHEGVRGKRPMQGRRYDSVTRARGHELRERRAMTSVTGRYYCVHWV